MIFTIFFREKGILHTGYEKLLQPWVYPWSYPQEESSHLKIPIKSCVRNLIQRYSVERIRLNKTWMNLKLTKILVSLHCVHSLSISIMSCPSKIPFKFPLHEVKIECIYRVLLKFMFSKKATQIDKIFTVNLSNHQWRFCQFLWPS
jgi:hypothetical protein